MPRFEVDLWLDGYDTIEESIAPCEEFIYEQLNMTASSVKIKRINKNNNRCPNCVTGKLKTITICPVCGYERRIK